MNARRSERLLDGLTYVGLTLCALVFLLPILWIVRTSFTTKAIAYQIPPKWLITPTLDNYHEIFTDTPFGKYFMNSLVVSLMSTCIAVFLSAMAAFWDCPTGEGRKLPAGRHSGNPDATADRHGDPDFHATFCGMRKNRLILRSRPGRSSFAKFLPAFMPATSDCGTQT